MVEKYIDSTINALPPHKHRTLHILLSILVFLVVVGSITYYKIYNAEPLKENTEEPKVQKNTQTLSADERNQAIADLKTAITESPPITNKEREQAIQQLKKVMTN